MIYLLMPAAVSIYNESITLLPGTSLPVIPVLIIVKSSVTSYENILGVRLSIATHLGLSLAGSLKFFVMVVGPESVSIGVFAPF